MSKDVSKSTRFFMIVWYLTAVYSIWMCTLSGTHLSGVLIGLIISLFVYTAAHFFTEREIKNGILVSSVILFACSTYIVGSFVAGGFLVVVPEKGGISEARVIKGIGLLTHPFSDKLFFIQREYAVEADVVIDTDNERTIIARSQKKKFRVIDPIAVYHRIGEKVELIETHLRDGVERCFYQEISAKYLSSMLSKKTPDSFFIQSMPCGLGLKYYGFEPVGGNQISFANFHLTDIAPINLQIE